MKLDLLLTFNGDNLPQNDILAIYRRLSKDWRAIMGKPEHSIGS